MLSETEPTPARLFNPSGNGPFVFGCEHAGNRIPEALGTLGLTEAELTRHIAWDIGAARLTELIADGLDCPAVLQNYSRLVYDCNRTVDHEGAFVIDADGSFVKGNADLTTSEKLAREKAIYRPFHDKLTALIEHRLRHAERFGYVAVHSFNETVRGKQRPWHIGMIYNQHSTMSKFLIDWFRANTAYVVGDNEPYSPADAVDHTIRVQAEARSIPYTMIEVRNDLLRNGIGVMNWAVLISDALNEYATTHIH